MVIYLLKFRNLKLSLVTRKPFSWFPTISDTKTGCTTTKGGYQLGISDLRSRKIELSMKRNQGRSAPLVFTYANSSFLMTRLMH